MNAKSDRKVCFEANGYLSLWLDVAVAWLWWVFSCLIQVYQFPECDSDEDEDFKQQDRELKAAVPFAVVAADTVMEVGGRRVRGRQYPWGIVDG